MRLAESSIQLQSEVASTPRLFFWVASLLYGGVLVTGGYYTIVSGNTLAIAPWRFVAFVGLLLILLLLECSVQRYPVARLAKYTTAGFLVARMVLIELVVAVDDSGLSRALYPIVPFTAYFSLGKRVSYALALFYLSAFVVRLSLFVPSWYSRKEELSDVLMFFIGLVFAISMAHVASEADANRRRAERFLNDLAVSHQQLKLYAEQTAELAAAEERNRLARDIHDGLGHYLTAIIVLLEKAFAFRLRQPQEAEIALVDARRLTREALRDVRQSVGSLRLSSELFSLSSSLDTLVKNMKHGFTINLEITGTETDFPKSVLMSLYRAAQEALTNVQKHARASHVSLRVLLHEHEANMYIDDDGQGFDTAILEKLPPGRADRFGLQGVRERLEMLEGILKVESYPGQGTHVFITIPKKSI